MYLEEKQLQQDKPSNQAAAGTSAVGFWNVNKPQHSKLVNWKDYDGGWETQKDHRLYD